MKAVSFAQALGDRTRQFSPNDRVAIGNLRKIRLRNPSHNGTLCSNHGGAANSRSVNKGHFTNMLPSPPSSHFSTVHQDANATAQYEVQVVVLPALDDELLIGGQFGKPRESGECSSGRHACRKELLAKEGFRQPLFT